MAVAAVAAMGCAAQRAQGPLDVRLGLSPADTARAVKAYDFCRRADADADAEPDVEIFPQCGRPGVVYGDAWVVAHYQGGRVVRLQRFERWADPDRATTRWNQLIERRSAAGRPSRAAQDRLFARQGLPEGTKAWVAFEHGDQLIGLYLLTSSDPSSPSILEELEPLAP